MENVAKTVIEVDPEFLKSVNKRLERIEEGLINMRAIKPEEWLSPAKFCAETNISRWQFDMYKNCGQLAFKKIGKKIYVARNQVEKYFQGLMKLPD